MIIPFPDWRWNTDYFKILPVNFLFQVIRIRDKKFTEFINLVNYTSAIGWSSLSNGFGGKTKHSDFLPFEQEKLTEDKNLTPATIRIIKQLQKSKKLPRFIIMDLLARGYLKDLFD